MKPTTKTVKQCLVLSVLLAGNGVVPAMAQTSASGENAVALEEVLVTARKREESLQETPLAVSAFSGQALQEAGIENFTDLQNHVPSLDISTAFKGGLITIRSVAPTGGGGPWAEQPAGIYVDDVFQAHGTSRLLDLVDIQSVQVLRGPQGTLFGKNTSAGALVLTTEKPADEVFGNATLSLGNYGRQELKLSYNTPLIEDKLLGKFIYKRVRQEGFYENTVDGDEFYGSHRDSFGVQLRWLAAEDTIVDTILTRSRDIEIPRASTCEPVDYGDDTTPIIGILLSPEHFEKNYTEQCQEVAQLPFGKVSNSPYDHNNKGHAQGSFDLRSTYLSVNVQIEGESIDFKSTTAWGLIEQFDRNAFDSDLDGTPLNVAYIFNRETVKQDQISQEFQFSGTLFEESLSWTAGLFGMQQLSGKGDVETLAGTGGIVGVRLSDASVPDDATLAASAAGLDPDETIVVVNVRTANNPEVSSKTWAAYGQLSWDMTERLELTAGLRYSVEYKEAGSLSRRRQLTPGEIDNGVNAVLYIPPRDGGGELYFSTTNPAVAGPRATFQELPGVFGNPIPMRVSNDDQQDDVSYSQITPMLSAAYLLGDSELHPDVNSAMFYATISAGWKAGGLRPTTETIIPFDPEELTNYEVGMKLDMFDSSLRLNGNVFFMDYRDKQTLIAIPSESGIQVDQVLANVDSVSLTGTEWELLWKPDANWELNAGFSYVDDDIHEFNDSRVVGDDIITIDRSNERSFNTRSTSANVGAQYATESDLGRWVARIDVSYKSDLYWGLDADTWTRPGLREKTTTPAQTLLSGRLTWVPDDRWRVTLWGKNLTDEEYVANGLGTTQTFANVVTILAPPRTLGLDVSYDFR